MLKVVIIDSMSVSSLFMIVGGADFLPIIAWKCSKHIWIFQLFKVKLESCALWLADSFQVKVEDHHQQVMVTSNVCSWKTLCSGTIHP